MKKRKFWNWVRDSDTGERTLVLNGTIAEESWFGDEVTPAIFRDELTKGEGDITVWINSLGGDVYAAAQIYNMLMDYKGKVIVENMSFFFCHAGIDSALPLEEQDPEDLLIYNGEVVTSQYNGSAVLVVGHTQVCKLIPGRYTPLVRGKVIMMDTSAKRLEGKLSCMDVLTGQVWQSS